MTSWLERLRDEDAGFTLIELLVTLAILGIMLTTVTLAVIQGFDTTTRAEARVDRSNLADFASGAFGADVASAPTAPSVHMLAAHAAAPCGTGSSLVDLATATAGRTISYVATSSDATLRRRVCDGAVVVKDAELGSSIAAFASGTTGATCVDDTSVSPPVACRTVTLVASWSSGEPRSFTLRGTRRVG